MWLSLLPVAGGRVGGRAGGRAGERAAWVPRAARPATRTPHADASYQPAPTTARGIPSRSLSSLFPNPNFQPSNFTLETASSTGPQKRGGRIAGMRNRVTPIERGSGEQPAALSQMVSSLMLF